jgi:ankyrin repeat protein
MTTIWTLAATGTLTKGSLLDQLDKDPGLLDREDGSGITPLGYALINGKTNVVKLLLENQANPDKVMGESMPFPDGRTPAFLAAGAKKGAARMMQLLLKKNPKSFDKPIASNKDQTPLMMAVRAQNTEVVKMLMEKGASVDKRRTDGKSPIDLANALPDGSKKTAIQAALQPNLKGGGGLRTYVKSWAVRVLGRFKIFKPLGSILKGATRYFQKLAPPIEPDDVRTLP